MSERTSLTLSRRVEDEGESGSPGRSAKLKKGRRRGDVTQRMQSSHAEMVMMTCSGEVMGEC